MPLGQGRVNYPAFIRKLKEIGYEGDITIEQEISGEEQKKDILMGKKLLEGFDSSGIKEPLYSSYQNTTVLCFRDIPGEL